jgi:hypothetical protein
MSYDVACDIWLTLAWGAAEEVDSEGGIPARGDHQGGAPQAGERRLRGARGGRAWQFVGVPLVYVV